MINLIFNILELVLFIIFCVIVYKTIKFYEKKLKNIIVLVRALKKQCIINKNIKWYDVKRTCDDIENIIMEEGKKK